jgi:hypothetical protein
MGCLRLCRPPGAASCGLVWTFAAEGVCVRIDLAGPPAVAARGDRNGCGEIRAVRQLVGGSPAKLEELAEVPDADQPVAGPPGWPGSRGPGTCRVWRATHGLPLAAAASGSPMILAYACLCPVPDGLRLVPPSHVPPQPGNSRIGWTAMRYLTPFGRMRGYRDSRAVVPELGMLCGALAAAGGGFSCP